ncbi:hypothetical protein LguiB_029106 [Lonicera macranthoides]
MFKSARWKKEKTKIKAVFKLQFQATRVPKQKKGKGLMISLVPADVGKPTVRLRKAPIVEGTCSWENPIYETVKLTKETKTGIYKEKIYYFDVSTGSSKAGYLGETSIDFAEFAEATNAFIVSLPLDASDSGPLLHVTVERMQGNDDLREGEENEAQRPESLDGSLRNQNGDFNGYGNSNLGFIEVENFNRETSREAEATIHQNLTNHRQNCMPQMRTIDVISTEKLLHSRSNTEWSLGSASEGSMMDSTNSPEERFPRNMPEVTNNPLDLLKMEISKLERQAETSDMELQSLRKQIVKESKRGQDLWQKIVSLKEEKEALNAECEQLKSAPNSSSALLEEKNKEVKHEKDLNKRLRLQLHRTEDSNSELVLAVKDLNKMLDLKSKEISHLSSKLKDSKEATEQLFNEHNSAKETDLLKQNIEDLYEEIEVNRKEKEELSMRMERLGADYKTLKQENQNLSSMLEGNRLEQMNMQNEYSDSLATIKEFKLEVERLENEIEKQALESLDKINELENHVKSLENELEKQTRDFEDDLEAVTEAKVEQEQRAIRAEEDLRRTRWSNSNAAERLQEEFKRLSVEMASKFDENEKLANDLRTQKTVLEEKLQKAKEDWERELASVRKEAEEKLLVKSSALRDLKDEKEIIVGTLQSEIKSLKFQHDELKHCLCKTEREKEDLRKQVLKLEGDLQEKEEATTSLAEKVKSLEEKIGQNEAKQEKDLENQSKGISKKFFAKVPVKSETQTYPEKELKVSNSHIRDDSNLKILLSEVSSLKERNKHMEVELKEMQEKYSEVSLRFAEVEGERQHLVMTLRNLKKK